VEELATFEWDCVKIGPVWEPKFAAFNELFSNFRPFSNLATNLGPKFAPQAGRKFPVGQQRAP